jgi:hypothetical protein
MKHLVFLFFAGLLALGGCQSGSEIVGLANTTDQLNIRQTDTLTVTSSTILADSIQTSGSGLLLVGRTVNVRSGTVLARAFFQPFANNGFALSGTESRIQYDSLVLQLGYRKAANYNAAYGDTSQTQTLNLFQYKTRPDEGDTYFNTSQLPLADRPLVSLRYRPRPGADAFLRVKLPDALGRQLFDLIRSGKLANNDELLDILPGFALLPGATDDGAILTFLNTSGIILYYHDSDLDVNKYQFGIGIRAGNSQFNYIENNRKGTPLAGLSAPGRDAVASRLTNEETYVQYGAGLRTIYRIPGLDNLRLIPGFANVNRAELIVKPLRFSLRDNAIPPTQLVLQPINANNEATASSLINFDGTPVVAPLQVDNSQLLPTYFYSFLLTGFVSGVAKGTIPNQGLLLAPQPGSDQGLAVSRTALGSQRNPDKDSRLVFRVFYTTNQ